MSGDKKRAKVGNGNIREEISVKRSLSVERVSSFVGTERA